MNFIERLERDLAAPIAVRGFGSGWFSGFFALLMACAGLCLVAALRWPDWFATPELAGVLASSTGRVVVHLLLIGAYALALLSLLLRPRKAIGFTALGVALLASLLGGANVSARETQDWGIFFGIDFFAVNRRHPAGKLLQRRKLNRTHIPDCNRRCPGCGCRNRMLRKANKRLGCSRWRKAAGDKEGTRGHGR